LIHELFQRLIIYNDLFLVLTPLLHILPHILVVSVPVFSGQVVTVREGELYTYLRLIVNPTQAKLMLIIDQFFEQKIKMGLTVNSLSVRSGVDGKITT